jgi:putative Mg2+ transporter-C (MgtC) family protein
VLTPLQQVEIMAQLALTALLCMLIGLDRERSAKPAGLRTHMLAGIGACLFTALGLKAFPVADTSRVAAGVVSGIGFLGAGTIFRQENRVRALTTAASIWSTAAVGMAVGVGAWLLAISATVIIWAVLAVLHNWEVKRFAHADSHAVQMAERLDEIEHADDNSSNDD